MQDVVLFFRDEYRFLSNFFPSTVELDGIEYKTVEHAYQAAKTTDKTKRFEISQEPTPGRAREIGKGLTKIQNNWDELRHPMMVSLVQQKFENHQNLRQKLLATELKTLVEGNFWHDTYWGVCFCFRHGYGENHLGRILHSIRYQYNKK